MTQMTAQELAEFRSDTDALFPDLCQIGTQVTAPVGKNPTGGAWTYDTVNTEPCGVNDDIEKRGAEDKEIFDGSQQTITDTTIRLRFDAPVSSVNRLKVIKRDGSTLATPEVFAILGTPKLTAAELIARCRFVTEGSVR